MATAGSTTVSVRVSTWRLTAALWFVQLCLFVIPSWRLGSWFLRIFERHGLRFLTIRME